MDLEKKRRGIQSVEVGTQLLIALAQERRALSLSDLSRLANLTPGRAHPYLVSYINMGLVEQDPSTGLYQLGPFCLELGLVRLNQLDIIKIAAPLVNELATNTELSVALAVWGNMGPTIVQLIEPYRPLHVNMRPGTVMSLTNTATGHVFAAYLPEQMIKQYLNSGQHALTHNPRQKQLSQKQFATHINATKENGMAQALGIPIPGIHALSVPVFGLNNHIELALTIMGTSEHFDASFDGAIAQKLLALSQKISYSLGKL